MTVAAHGSDVQHRQTTATYDAETHEFAIDTPADEAHEEHIGNAAVHGFMAAVFARLVVGGASHWVHALVVSDPRRRRHPLRRRPDRGLRREARNPR